MDIQKFISVSLTFTLLTFTTTAFSLITANTPNKVQGAPMLLASANKTYIPTPEEDAKITKTIKTHINKSKILSRFNIEVKTYKGVVTLTGNVDSNAQASRLIQLAQSIVGVHDVQSRLTIQRSKQVLRDTLITAKVQGLLLREGIFGPKRGVALMRVETRNGIVYLTGHINNKQKIERAIDLISGVSGVRKVEYKFTKIIPPENGQ